MFVAAAFTPLFAQQPTRITVHSSWKWIVIIKSTGFFPLLKIIGKFNVPPISQAILVRHALAAVVDVALESHRLQRKIAFMCAVLSEHFTLIHLFSDAFDISMCILYRYLLPHAFIVYFQFCFIFIRSFFWCTKITVALCWKSDRTKCKPKFYQRK